MTDFERTTLETLKATMKAVNAQAKHQDATQTRLTSLVDLFASYVEHASRNWEVLGESLREIANGPLTRYDPTAPTHEPMRRRKRLAPQPMVTTDEYDRMVRACQFAPFSNPRWPHMNQGSNY